MNDPYAPPVAELNEQGDVQSVSLDDLQSFTQEKHYVDRWRTRHQRGHGWTGFNWPALLVGPIWCFYRKQWWLGIGYWVAYFAAVFIGAIAYAFATADIESANERDFVLIAIGAMVLVRLILAAFANNLYYRNAVRLIGKLRRQARDEADAIARILRRGGTSAWGMMIGIAINVIMQVLDKLTA